MTIEEINMRWNYMMEEEKPITPPCIRFSEDAKTFDGTSDNAMKFAKLVIGYFNGTMTGTGLNLLCNSDLDLVNYMIDECFILQCRIENFEKEKYVKNVVDEFVYNVLNGSKKNNNNFIKKIQSIGFLDYYLERMEKMRAEMKSFEHDNYWDSQKFSLAAKEKGKSKGVPVVRHGSRDFGFLIKEDYISYVNSLLDILVDYKNYRSFINEGVVC